MTERAPERPANEESTVWQARVAALEAENAHLRAALRAGRIGHLTVDPATGDPADYSPEYLELHRLPPGTSGETKDEWLARVHPEDRARADHDLSDALASHSSDYRSEFRVLSGSDAVGRWIAARGAMQAADSVTGDPEHLAVAQHDVTERRNIEDALRESEAHYRWAADSSPQVPWMADAEGRIIDFGQRWTVLTGMSRERTLAGEWIETIHPDDLARVQATWGASVRTGAPFDIEHRVRVTDGSYRWVRARATARRDAEGRVVRWYGTTEDVHDYHAALAALERSHQEARLAAERVQLALDAGAIIGTWVWELPTDCFTVDERFAQTFGLDPALGYNGLSLEQVVATVHPDDLAGLRAAIAEAIARGGPYRHEYRVWHRDGVYRWIEANGRVELGPDGTPLRFPGVLLDIEERRGMEAARDRATALLHSVIEAVPGVVYAKDRAGRMLMANEGTATLIGKRPEHFLGKTDAEFLTDKVQAAAVMANDRRVMEQGVAEQVEEVVSLPDGTPAIWLSSKAPLRDAAGDIIGVVGTSIDITARKAAEAALAVSEARFRAAVEAVNGILWTNDAAGEMRGEQPGWAALTGQRFEEYQGFGWSKAVHPDDAQPTIDAWNQAVAERRPFVFEHRLRRHDGAWRHFAVRAIPVLDADGAIREWVGVHTDITAQREGEAFLRSVLDAHTDCLKVLDTDGRLEFMNANGQCLMEIDRFDDFQGREWTTLWPDDRQARLREAVHQALSGHPDRFEAFCPTAKGTPKWWDVAVAPVRNATGQTVRLVVASRDVTDRKDVEAALREESHTLEVLNRSGAALAAELELSSIVQKVTDAATELSGAAFGAFFYNVVERGKEAYTLYAISGVPRGAFSKFPMPRNTAVFAPTFHGEGTFRSEDITADPRYGQNAPHRGMPEGHLPVRSYLAVPVVSRSGEVLGGLFFGHPQPGMFTERAERLVTGIAAQAAIAIDNARLYQAAQHEVEARTAAEEELRQLNETLERLVEERTAALQVEVEERRRAEEAARQSEKLAAIGQLTGGIAHDFNNIVQVVASGATLLGLPGLTEERRGAILDGLAKATESAKELTSRLLAFARKQTLQPEAFDLNERLSGMAEMLRHTLGSRIRVETDVCAELWPVMADQGQFEVAVLNLAVNARDAMLPEGGTLTLATRNVTLEATAERAAGEYVCLTVKDTGKGMPPAVLARVFEPFFTTKGQAGTGLGLPQVHGFAKQSGGDIAIESVPGQGTTILFHLPRAVLAPGAAAPRSNVSLEARLERTAGKTVLVVDDNPDVASFAASMLEGLGYTTRRATNAADALILLAEDETIDAVFSDVVMPGEMDGVQLASTLRLGHPHLAIVLATGYSQVLAEWRGKAVAEVLSKPYRLDDLAAALERALAARATDTKEADATASPPGSTAGGSA